jgi:AcrR family transcriptional regulator
VTRTYDMTSRARLAAETSARITDETERLLIEMPIGEITLQHIAAGADVTVQTVLRHMGSRNGCFEAVGRAASARVRDQRGHTEPGDVPGAISSLVAHYEAEGRLVLNMLAQEHTGDDMARQATEIGRQYHREWVQRCFGPALDRLNQEAIDALVAATDLYLWKLMRLDLGRSPAATEAVMTTLVQGVLETS